MIHLSRVRVLSLRLSYAWAFFALFGLGPAASAAGAETAAHSQPAYEAIRLGRGHFNRLCLAATIGGKKGLMILDSGASHSLLNESTYHSVLPSDGHPLPLGMPKSASVNGMPVPVAITPDYHVGKSNLGAVVVGLVPRRYLYQSSPSDGYAGGRVYDGLLGENVLRQYNAVIDCGQLILYFSTNPRKKLRFAADFVEAGWTRIPMSDLGNNFTVPCVLHGHKFRLIVDTGAPFTNLDRNLLRTADVTSRDLPLRGGIIGTKAQQEGLVSVNTLQIGDYTVSDIHMTTNSQSFGAFAGAHDHSSDGPIVGLFGGDALANNGAIMDVGDKFLYLKRAAGKAAKTL